MKSATQLNWLRYVIRGNFLFFLVATYFVLCWFVGAPFVTSGEYPDELDGSIQAIDWAFGISFVGCPVLLSVLVYAHSSVMRLQLQFKVSIACVLYVVYPLSVFLVSLLYFYEGYQQVDENITEMAYARGTGTLGIAWVILIGPWFKTYSADASKCVESV